MSHSQPLYHMLMRQLPLILVGFVASLVSAASGYAQQVVYYSPVVAQPTPYVTSYTPSGTYSAVTAYSPPVAAAVPGAPGTFGKTQVPLALGAPREAADLWHPTFPTKPFT